MKYCSYDVLRNANYEKQGVDCTNNGLSHNVTSGKMFWDCTRQEALSYCVANNMNPNLHFFLVKRTLWGLDYSYATPLFLEEPQRVMFGGNFLYTSDSSSYKFGGEETTRPIQIFDRIEK